MKILFWIYLVVLILRPQEFIPGLIGLPILQILLLICLAIWVASAEKRLDLPQFTLVLVLFFLMPLTIALSGWWGGVPAAVAYLVPVMGIFVIASMAGRDTGTLRFYMWTIIGCACLLVLHSQIQMETGIGPLTGALPQLDRPYYVGIFADPNDLGQLFVIALAFAVYLVAVNGNFVIKLALVGAVGYLLYGMIITDSRGALMATLVVLGMEGWRRYGKIAVGVSAALGLPALFAATRLSQLSAGEQSANDRIVAWYEGIQMVRAHPLNGVGFGRFTEHHILTAHNFIVLPMAELGVPGLTLWMGLLWYSFLMLWWIGYGPHAKVDRNATQPMDPRWAEEILAGKAMFVTWVGFAVSAFFLSQSYKAPLFLLTGFAVARFAQASKVLPNPPTYHLLRDLPKIGLFTLLCMGAIYVLVMRTI